MNRHLRIIGRNFLSSFTEALSLFFQLFIFFAFLAFGLWLFL